MIIRESVIETDMSNATQAAPFEMEEAKEMIRGIFSGFPFSVEAAERLEQLRAESEKGGASLGESLEDMAAKLRAVGGEEKAEKADLCLIKGLVPLLKCLWAARGGFKDAGESGDEIRGCAGLLEGGAEEVDVVEGVHAV